MANGAETAAPLLEARHISKFIGAITALNDVNFRLDQGEIMSVAGDNGAGKESVALLKNIAPAEASDFKPQEF